MKNFLSQAKEGFNQININKKYKQDALVNLKSWLTKIEFREYVPQLKNLIANKHWDYLLDCFYQVIPFGTGGRRGEIGVGPNRINPWTIQASAQGHSQYLLKKYGKEAKTRGIVFAFDVREFTGNEYLDNKLSSPLQNLKSKDLAVAAAEVYTANKLKVFMFDDIRTTPELSFAIRELKAVAGAMFSASHNPPTHNGKKVYDEFGGQLIPPDDEDLVSEVTQNVKAIKTLDYLEAKKKKLLVIIGSEIDKAYIKVAMGISLSKARDIKIAYTPLHGCGMTSVYKTLQKLGFKIWSDPKTSNPSGKFENVTFNIPNPEVIQSFDIPLRFAKTKKTDILLNSDPDADRIGIMVNHQGKWKFLNGNEIAAILTEYVIQKKKDQLTNKAGVVVKTTVTTNLLKSICEQNDVKLIGELLIGFKYIGYEMNKLEKEGQVDNFLLGCEESHGYLTGNYARDKDAVTAAVWLAELAAELKQKNKTLVDYLADIHAKYGYYRNYLTEIRLLGASGREKIERIQNTLRQKIPKSFGSFKIKSFEDALERKPLVSETDKVAKNVLIFQLEPAYGTASIKVTIRPSGTEPKSKMYFEIGMPSSSLTDLPKVKEKAEEVLDRLEKAVMKTCYSIIDVDFPERGFLLFWQLPLDSKLKYFEIESDIEKLKSIANKQERQKKLEELLSFLGSDPVMKIDKAFKSKHKVSVLKYLGL